MPVYESPFFPGRPVDSDAPYPLDTLAEGFEAFEDDEGAAPVGVRFDPRALRRLQLLLLSLVAYYESRIGVEGILESAAFSQGYGRRHPEFFDAVARRGAAYWAGNDAAYIRARWAREAFGVAIKMFADYVREECPREPGEPGGPPFVRVTVGAVDDFDRGWGVGALSLGPGRA